MSLTTAVVVVILIVLLGIAINDIQSMQNAFDDLEERLSDIERERAEERRSAEGRRRYGSGPLAHQDRLVLMDKWRRAHNANSRVGEEVPS